jgi:hypothetical protein
MARGAFSPFRAKHVILVQAGDTAWSEDDMNSTDEALDTSFNTNNSTPLIDLAGAANLDSATPTTTACWIKNYSESGNERSTSEENLVGVDGTGSQCQELSADTVSKRTVSFTMIYRNNVPVSIFNDTTKCFLISMDNGESSTTGEVNFAYNNVIMTHVGSLSRNAEGFLEQQLKFEIRGGLADDEISVSQPSPDEDWSRIRVGPDYAEEVRIA